MEKVVYTSKYAIAKFDDETGIHKLTYLSETANMLNQDWKDLMKELVHLNDKFKPKYIIDDNRDRYYAYPPDMQEWTLNLFSTCWNRIGLKKYVQIVSNDFVSKLSGEQIEDLAITKFSGNYEKKFVENMEDAIKWIKE